LKYTINGFYHNNSIKKSAEKRLLRNFGSLAMTYPLCHCSDTYAENTHPYDKVIYGDRGLNTWLLPQINQESETSAGDHPDLPNGNARVGPQSIIGLEVRRK